MHFKKTLGRVPKNSLAIFLLRTWEKQHKAECPRILQQLSYNLHRKNNTASCQRTPRIHPENLKIPSQSTPKNTLKCLQNPPWEPPGTRPEKSSLIALHRVPQGSPRVPKTDPKITNFGCLFSLLFLLLIWTPISTILSPKWSPKWYPKFGLF